jgi:lysophospholipase L1-like esterase
LDVIDLHTPTSGHEELFPDKLHPNAVGEGVIARTIADYLK